MADADSNFFPPGQSQGQGEGRHDSRRPGNAPRRAGVAP
jgi:hypothetical protein